MRRAMALVAAAVVACSRPAPPPPLPAGVLAHWSEGDLTVEDVDRILRASGGGDDAARLRDLVEAEAVARVLDSSGALEAASRDPGFSVRLAPQLRDRLATAWLRRHNSAFEVTPAEIEARFEVERERWERPERREFRHLLVAPTPGEPIEATCRRAEALAAQVTAGASFEALAREHSASESRAVGGLVGAVPRAALRGAVGELVFSIEAGIVSAPVATPVGCQIFLVTSIEPASRADLLLLAPQISEAIADERRRVWLRDLLSSELQRFGLDGSALEALDDDTPADRLLLELDGELLTAADARAGRRPGESLRDAAFRLAGALVLPRSMAVDDPAEAAEIEARARRELALDLTREETLAEAVAAVERPALEAFFAMDPARFGTEPELELTLASWRIPTGRDPLELRARAAALGAGFAASGAAALEGSEAEIVSLPRGPLRELVRQFPALGRLGLEELAPGRVVGPWHAGGFLYLARVDVFVEPRDRAFAEVEAEVRVAWLAENRERLLREWRQSVLATNAVRVADDAAFEQLGVTLASRLLSAPAAAPGEE